MARLTSDFSYNPLNSADLGLIMMVPEWWFDPNPGMDWHCKP